MGVELSNETQNGTEKRSNKIAIPGVNLSGLPTVNNYCLDTFFTSMAFANCWPKALKWLAKCLNSRNMKMGEHLPPSPHTN